MKRILLTILTMLLIIPNVSARKVSKDFSAVINDSGVNIESIAVSIKNIDNGKVLYSLNDKMLMNPASVQKILTTPVIAETLGNDYLFTTGIYSKTNGVYAIKLGADPYLNSSDIKTLVKNIEIDAKKVLIDDTILDNKTWGEGWQWDDDLNILMPKFSSYNCGRLFSESS